MDAVDLEEGLDLVFAEEALQPGTDLVAEQANVAGPGLQPDANPLGADAALEEDSFGARSRRQHRSRS